MKWSALAVSVTLLAACSSTGDGLDGPDVRGEGDATTGDATTGDALASDTQTEADDAATDSDAADGGSVEPDVASGDLAGVDAVDGDGSLVPDGGHPLDPASALPPRASEQRCRLGAVDEPEYELPRSILETECFVVSSGVGDSPALLTPAPELIPFEVNAELWSDGSHKTRFFSLPPGSTIGVNGDAEWSFPVGSVLVKTFAFRLQDHDEGAWVPVETRFMVHRESGWTFHSYRWSDDGADATLLDANDTRTISVEGLDAPLRYAFPSPEQCGYCHASSAETVLGPRTPQLDRAVRYPGGVADQLEVLTALGVFDGSSAPATARPFADPHDPDAPVSDRARAYMAANCAHCHQPGGWKPPLLSLDLRFDRTLAETRTCDVPIQYTSPDVAGRHRVVPGDPAASNLLQRMMTTTTRKMPPFGARVDDDGVALISRWITELESCP